MKSNLKNDLTNGKPKIGSREFLSLFISRHLFRLVSVIYILCRERGLNPVEGWGKNGKEKGVSPRKAQNSAILKNCLIFFCCYIIRIELYGFSLRR